MRAFSFRFFYGKYFYQPSRINPLKPSKRSIVEDSGNENHHVKLPSRFHLVNNAAGQFINQLLLSRDHGLPCLGNERCGIRRGQGVPLHQRCSVPCCPVHFDQEFDLKITRLVELILAEDTLLLAEDRSASW